MDIHVHVFWNCAILFLSCLSYGLITRRKGDLNLIRTMWYSTGFSTCVDWVDVDRWLIHGPPPWSLGENQNWDPTTCTHRYFAHVKRPRWQPVIFIARHLQSHGKRLNSLPHVPHRSTKPQIVSILNLHVSHDWSGLVVSVSLEVNLYLSSDKETCKDLPSDSEAFEVEQVLSLIISYLGGKKQFVHLISLVVFHSKYTVLYISYNILLNLRWAATQNVMLGHLHAVVAYKRLFN